MVDMIRKQILPAVFDYTRDLAQGIALKAGGGGPPCKSETELLNRLSTTADRLYETCEALNTHVQSLPTGRTCAGQITATMCFCGIWPMPGRMQILWRLWWASPAGPTPPIPICSSTKKIQKTRQYPLISDTAWFLGSRTRMPLGNFPEGVMLSRYFSAHRYTASGGVPFPPDIPGRFRREAPQVLVVILQDGLVVPGHHHHGDGGALVTGPFQIGQGLHEHQAGFTEQALAFKRLVCRSRRIITISSITSSKGSIFGPAACHPEKKRPRSWREFR